ncbi:division plane positioning ATPase MipZ [Pseudomonas savastanoi]|uniref:division plane positioning ATPase MipZ n=1 Tax=Pseudomonas savastanoi TaxID=29438 RepID=UPI001F213A30|nr:division plane positioning ATPase MipZ [Pseudomonas savastanoi]
MTCYGDISKDIRKLETVTDVVFVDTAGHDSMELRSALTVADIFLTPVKPSSLLEIATLDGLSSIVREAQKKIPVCKASPCSTDAQHHLSTMMLKTSLSTLKPILRCYPHYAHVFLI